MDRDHSRKHLEGGVDEGIGGIEGAEKAATSVLDKLLDDDLAARKLRDNQIAGGRGSVGISKYDGPSRAGNPRLRLHRVPDDSQRERPISMCGRAR